MQNSTMAKVAGWGQFAVQILGQLATSGLPTGALGWMGLVSSLLAAVGVHAASTTDGSK